MDEGKLQDLKNEYGNILLYTVEGKDFVFRRPNRADYRRMKMEIGLENKKHMATENLAISCLVFPERKEYDATLDRWPAFADRVANDLAEMLGTEEVFQKKTL